MKCRKCSEVNWCAQKLGCHKTDCESSKGPRDKARHDLTIAAIDDCLDRHEQSPQTIAMQNRHVHAELQRVRHDRQLVLLSQRMFIQILTFIHGVVFGRFSCHKRAGVKLWPPLSAVTGLSVR